VCQFLHLFQQYDCVFISGFFLYMSYFHNKSSLVIHFIYFNGKFIRQKINNFSVIFFFHKCIFHWLKMKCLLKVFNVRKILQCGWNLTAPRFLLDFLGVFFDVEFFFVRSINFFYLFWSPYSCSELRVKFSSLFYPLSLALRTSILSFFFFWVDF
jgi:hypothetical protein